MFLYYQHLTIVWILLQFLNYSEQTTYGKFFSSLPVELSEQAFPVTYKSNHSSDVVIVKCPGLKYKHIGIKDHFVLDEDLRKTGLLYLTDNEVFAWTPAVYNSSGPSSVHCGIFYQDNANSPGIIKYNWTFNMNWEMKPNPQKIEELQTITTKPTFMGNKCGTDQTLTMVYHKDRKKGMKKFEMDNKVTAHVNDLYYYFNKPDNNDKMEVKGPCAIVRAVNEPPQIIIENHNSSSIPYNKTKIYTIKQEYTSGSYSIKLHLEDEINLPDFYEGEKIKMKKMRYTRKGIKEIPNSDEIVTSTFSIQGFQLVKFSYDCPTTTGINVISKMFYFEPASKNYKFPNENTIYFPNETTIQPNCSIERVTFGYLDSVTVNSLTTNLNDLGKNGLSKNNLKRVGDFIFVLEVKGNNVTLNCNYVTLNGMVTLIQTFIQGKKVFVGYNDKGEEMYETRMINDKREELEKKLAEKDKELIAQKKSFFEKLKDKIGSVGAHLVMIALFLFIFFVILIIAILCCKKLLIPWIAKKKIQNKHPNIFIFWNEMSNQNLEVYAETIQDKKYIPDKLKDEKVSKKIEGGEVVEFNKNSLFDDSLVKCYKNIDKEIKAHYIKDISPVRTYIISDGPTFEKVDYFWELLYHEDVGVVFAILFQEHEINQDTHSKVFYWPQKKQRYGKVTVEFWEDIQSDIPFVMIKTFTMTILNKEPKKLTLFYISNWKEHDIPRSDRHLIKLYKEISQHAGTSNVLVHSSYGSGSRVFMFTYFCCILEAMKENTTIVDPLEIIKQVRSQRYGGNISSIEYAYIIKSLITYFFEYKMLVDITNHRLAFYDEYEDFILKLDGRVSSMDPNLINFLTFVNIIDHGKLKDLCDQSGYIEMPKDIDLRLQCKCFYTIANKKDIAMKKIRYIDVPCYDKSSITIRGKDSSDINSFIHANELVYKYGIENERKIIMCQGPLKETVDDMFDMIYRKKVGIVVVLISKEEMEKGEKCFPYLSTDKNEVSFGTYSLLYKGHEAGLNNFFIEYNYLIMNNTSKIKHTFKLLHYINWSDRSIPYENKSLYGLYKRITELYDNRHIAIHCSNGVGKTGTLALIIYMIDIIQSKSPFDPIKCLAKIRQHRYKAVQTTSQFVFALSILYEHFKKQIDDMDEKAYENFMSIAERIYNSNNNIRRN